MAQLPNEIIENIFSQVPFTSLIRNCTLVCRHWNRIISNAKFLLYKKSYFRLLSGCPKTQDKFDNIVKSLGILDNPHMLPTKLTDLLVDFKSRNDENMMRALEKHTKYQLISSFVKSSPEKTCESQWAVIGLLCLVAVSVADITELIDIMLKPSTNCLVIDCVECLYLLACIFWQLKSTNRLNAGLHYRVIYALTLFENGQKFNVDQGSAAANQIQMTHEQLAVINHEIRPQELIKIVAFAGTGKTTTLVEFTERRPTWSFLNVAYNKTTQLKADKLFPNNVESRTVHSLAYREIGSRYKGRLTGSLRISSVTKEIGGGFLHCQRVMKAISSYISSSRECLTIQDVAGCPPVGDKAKDEYYNSNEYKDTVVRDANKYWRKMIDVKSTDVYITHDGYLKLYQLSQPVLDTYDCILIDEAQDSTPAVAHILMRQNCAKIMVGDPHQQIYSFRGAKNIMNDVQSTFTYHLTKSFRFGPEIGYIANTLLETLKDVHDKTLTGNAQQGGIMGDIVGQLAVICRTNFTLFSKAVDVCRSGRNVKIAFAGGLPGYNWNRVLDIYRLYSGSGDIKEAFIRNMKTFSSLKKYAHEAPDPELLGKIKIVEVFRASVPGNIDAIKAKVTKKIEDADIVFSTVHKAKGLEFSTVQVAEDFFVDNQLQMAGIEMDREDKDEKNLLYVAVTRAQHRILLNKTIKNVLKSNKEHLLRPISSMSLNQTDELVCAQCYNPIQVDPRPHVIMERIGCKIMDSADQQGGLLCMTCALEQSPYLGCLY